MSRRPRIIEPGVVYHVFNRRTDRQCLFGSPRDFDNFFLLMEEGRERYKVRLCASCLMETHWHLALWAHDELSIGRYVRWLATTHAVRFRVASGTRGDGHVYGDRYKSVPVHGPMHYLALLRYIEANPMVAGLVSRAEDWRWSSLHERTGRSPRIIDDGPWPLPIEWQSIVNDAGPVLWWPLAPIIRRVPADPGAFDQPLVV
jgi:putative transposase